MTHPREQPPFIQIVLAFMAVYIVWGSTYVCNKICVNELPPFFLAGFRFVCAGLIVFLICAALGRKTPITFTKIKNACLFGFLFLTLGNGCLVYGMKFVDSGFAALFVAACPLIVIILMYLLKGQKVSLLSWCGIFLGMIGIYLLVFQDGFASTHIQWEGLVFLSISMFSWSYASIKVSDYDLPNDPFINTGVQMLLGGLILLLYSSFAEQHSHAPWAVSAEALWSMMYLIFFGSIVAFTAFNFLLLHVSPEKVSTTNYVNPVVALILGWLILDEKMTTQSLVAAMILLVGVYFVNTSKVKKLK